MDNEAKKIIGIVFAVAVIAVGALLVYGGGSNSSKLGTLPTVTPNASATDPALMRADSQQVKAPGAKVTIVEFADYECPYCKQMSPVVNNLLVQYKGSVNFVYRNFPLPQHQYAVLAAEAAEIAGDSGKFWQMHDLLFLNQDAWVNSSLPQDLFATYAEQAGLDKTQFASDLAANKDKDRVQQGFDDAVLLGVNSTPTFFVNGKVIVGGGDLKGAIDQALKDAGASTAAPAGTKMVQ